eukprot:s590_g20.t1
MPVKKGTIRVLDFTRQANASDKFLSNVTALPSFLDIQKTQFQKLQNLVGSMACNEEQSAKVAEVLTKLKHFKREHVETLLELLAKQCMEEMPKVPAIRGPSSDGQDYGSLHRYVTKDVWTKLQEPELCSRCHALCGLASTLGLHSPTERTLENKTCLINWKEWCDGMPSLMEKYQRLQHDKPLIRAVLKEYVSMKKGKKGNLEFALEQLPPVPADLPALHAKLYLYEEENLAIPPKKRKKSQSKKDSAPEKKRKTKAQASDVKAILASVSSKKLGKPTEEKKPDGVTEEKKPDGVTEERKPVVKKTEKKAPGKQEKKAGVKKAKDKQKKPKGPLKMDKKNVCSRAYHREYKEKLKTLGEDEAKHYARLAHQKAAEEWIKEFGQK